MVNAISGEKWKVVVVLRRQPTTQKSPIPLIVTLAVIVNRKEVEVRVNQGRVIVIARDLLRAMVERMQEMLFHSHFQSVQKIARRKN
jgi:hypothetical protein